MSLQMRKVSGVLNKRSKPVFSPAIITLINCIHYYNLPTVPGPPNSLNVSLLTVESISITWTEISSDQQYGIIIEYIVCIKEVGSANCTFMQTVDANSQPFSLNQTGLMPNTNYIITVQGRNSAGLGDTVETTIQTGQYFIL